MLAVPAPFSEELFEEFSEEFSLVFSVSEIVSDPLFCSGVSVMVSGSAPGFGLVSALCTRLVSAFGWGMVLGMTKQGADVVSSALSPPGLGGSDHP